MIEYEGSQMIFGTTKKPSKFNGLSHYLVLVPRARHCLGVNALTHVKLVSLCEDLVADISGPVTRLAQLLVSNKNRKLSLFVP